MSQILWIREIQVSPFRRVNVIIKLEKIVVGPCKKNVGLLFYRFDNLLYSLELAIAVYCG